MNRTDYQDWLTYLVITLALVAFGYMLGNHNPAPTTGEGVIKGGQTRQRNLNQKYSK